MSDESIFYPWGGVWHPGNGGSVTETMSPGAQIFFSQLAAYRGTQLSDLTLVERGPSLIFRAEPGETL